MRLAYLGLALLSAVSATVCNVDPSKINDGYCDCPETGEDEPDTDACSGSTQWPGVQTPDASAAPLFVCPQQPTLQIPHSRINDGICDCCDGMDEPGMRCPDTCAAYHAAREAQAKALQDAYAKGSALRKEQIQAYEAAVTEVQAKVVQQRTELREWQVKGTQSESQWKAAQQHAYEQNRQSVDAYVSRHEHVLDGLTLEELEGFVVSACQLAGELATDSSNTCVPLRLAGLDHGVGWRPETYQVDLVREYAPILGELLEHNLLNPDDKIWYQRTEKDKRRRLEEIYDDDMMYEDEYYGDMEDDDDEEDGPPKDSKRDELTREIMDRDFSRSRSLFLTQTTELVKKITDLVKEEDNEDGEESAEEQEPLAVDPMVLPLVRNTLEERQRTVRRGVDYAVSAKVLIDKLREGAYESDGDRRQDLVRLALGVVRHGNLSSFHAWHIVASLVAPPLPPTESDTCQSPWVGLCPSFQVERQGVTESVVSVPCNDLYSVGKGYCEGMSHECADPETIPTEVPDGFFGYYKLAARDESDMFAYTGAVADTEALQSLRDETEKLRQHCAKMMKEIDELLASIGGETPALGDDGELFALKDTCHSVEAGKYTYELCLMGSATQRDKGQKAGGTNLGAWVSPTKDEETGQRIWKWENGAKCWNGPQRSMTAYVTCGAETRVLSADEPDTCRYEVRVESHVACDEQYRMKHEL